MASNIIQQLIAEEGLTVIDAKKPITVTVKKCDSSKDDKKNPYRCAFASACKRQNRAIKRAMFFRSMAFLQIGKRIYRYRLPNAVRNEIIVFDRGGRVAEGKYVLAAISPSDTLRHKRKWAKSGKRVRKNIGRRHETANIRVANF